MIFDHPVLMAELHQPTPNWDAIADRFPHSQAMKDCIQDPDWHGEGSVWKHLQMIRDYMPNRIGDSQLWTLMYHDVAKAETRQIIDGHVSHPRHSILGATYAWREMWENDILQPTSRELVYNLILWHQRIFHIWKNPNMIRAAIHFNLNTNGRWLNLLDFARADMLGRISKNATEGLDNLDLLVDWLKEQDIANLCVGMHDKVFYFEGENRSPYFQAQPPAGSYVIMMSGLPGSGKDTHLSRMPMRNVISLDDIRKTLKIPMGENQGTVIQTALEQAKKYLRNKEEFVWNSTNLTRRNRDKIIKLFRDYDAFVHVNAMATPWHEILRRNKSRPLDKQVPVNVLERMLWSWEPIDHTQVHQVDWVTSPK